MIGTGSSKQTERTKRVESTLGVFECLTSINNEFLLKRYLLYESTLFCFISDLNCLIMELLAPPLSCITEKRLLFCRFFLVSRSLFSYRVL